MRLGHGPDDALGVAADKKGKSVYRTTLAELIEDRSKTEREGHLVEKVRLYTRIPADRPLSANCFAIACWAMDEIGRLSITQGSANLFFQLANARYEKGVRILTSNRGFAE